MRDRWRFASGLEPSARISVRVAEEQKAQLIPNVKASPVLGTVREQVMEGRTIKHDSSFEHISDGFLNVVWKLVGCEKFEEAGDISGLEAQAVLWTLKQLLGNS